MNSLATLIKLQKTRVDEQRIMLARLQETFERVLQTIAELEIRKAREQVAAQKDPAAAITYGQFLKHAVKTGRELERERQIAEAAVEAAHGKLGELFEEQKRYEIAEAARLEAEAKKERRRETIELDEIGGITHERKKN